MLTKLRTSYHNASVWAHHHTAVLVLGLTMIAVAFGWQFGSYVTYAAEPSAQHERCDAQESGLSLQIPLEECYVLADFYVATDGNNWYSTQNNYAPRFQGNGSSICRGAWYGVNNCSYDGVTGRQRIQNIGFNRTQEGNNLNGYIPNSLYTLPMLNTVHITRNTNLLVNVDDITQSPFVSNFTHINVHDSILQGDVNGFINMPNLVYLDVSCYSRTQMNTDNCTITGDTSFVPYLPNLYGLRLEGHIGITFNLNDLSTSPQLQQVHALNTYIVGDVSSLSGATGMQSLDLGCRGILEEQCNVTGNLDFVQNMSNLQYLSLDDLLNIEGTLDVLYDKVQLTQIDLTSNKISGTIGTGIGALTMLDALDLDDNLLEGALPEEMYNLILLDRLNIDDNNLTGALLDFREFPLLRELNIGANNMDYSNVWDMIVPEADASEPCYLPGPGMEQICPGLSTLQGLGIDNANIQGTIPDVWEKFPELTQLSLEFNKLAGPFPASFALLTNLNDLEIRFNNLDGEIPPYLATLQLDQGEFALEANCLDTDVQDPALLALLTDNSPAWNNQLNCRANIHIYGESTDDSLEAGQCAPYTIYYNNLGPQKAINLKIGQVFAENVVASGSTPEFQEGLVGREYGTANDPCYIDATQYGTGPYYDAYEYILVYESAYPFSSIYELAQLLGGYLGGEQFTGAEGTTEFAYVLDNFCPFVFGTTDHYLCLLLFGIDMKEVDDPTCGYGGETGYIRELGTVPAATSGSIQLEVCNQTEDIQILSCSDINVDTISENENLTTCDIEVQAGVCGDGNVDEGEQCDDGNIEDNDGCSATCQDEIPEEPQPYCGDAIMNGLEQCDDGEDNGQVPSTGQAAYGTSGSIAYCTETCTTASVSYQGGYCGDNTVNGPEQCDDGNNINGDGCSATCQDEDPDPTPNPYCGDGEVDPGEQCDGGVNCNANCTFKSTGGRDRTPTVTIDYCPDGDFSPSYYDDDCGIGPTIPQHASADDQEERDNLIDRPTDFNKAVADISKSMQCNIRNEMVQSYVFAFDLKITTINNICNANLEGEVTREEFAKFISSYAIAVLAKKPDTTRRCVFSDVSKTTTEMQTFARISCELNIMGLKQNGSPAPTFRPKDPMTRAEVFTALNRLINGTIDNSETGTRYTKHMNRLSQQKVILDTSYPQRNTLRGEVLLMLMRAYGVVKNR